MITIFNRASLITNINGIITIVIIDTKFIINIKNVIIFITPMLVTAYAATLFANAAFDCKSAMIVSMSIL